MHYEKFPDGSVKCIEDEIPFELPEGWEWCRFSKIIKLQSGQDLEHDKYNSNKNGLPYITGASNIENGNVIINRWTEYGRAFAYKGDILLTCKGTIGEVAILKQEKVHIARQIMGISPCKGINTSYLKYTLITLVENLKFVARSMIPGISRDDVLFSLIPVPPTNEQHRIADKISEIMSVIDNLESDKNDILSAIQLARSKILDLAIRGKLVPQDPNDEPASVLLERIRNEKEDLVKQGKIKRDKNESVIFRCGGNNYFEKLGDTIVELNDWEIDNIPESWEVCYLGEVCDYGNCINVEAENISETAWILDLEDIEKDTGRIIQRLTKKERDSASTKHLFHKGQVLYSKLRPYLNKVVLADDNGYCTSEILPLEFNACILPKYARYYLMSPTFLRYANHCSYGVKMPRLGTSDGKKAVLTVPPLNEQKRIVEKISALFEVLDNIEKNLN